jgi:hypothetical protein
MRNYLLQDQEIAATVGYTTEKCTIKRKGRLAESGLRRLSRKQEFGDEPGRGFESHIYRHLSLYLPPFKFVVALTT